MRLPSYLLSLALLIPGILATPLMAQDDAPAPEKPKAITIADPKVDVTHLEFMLDPLTKAELETEAAGWQAHVKESVQELSQLYIESSKQESEEAKQKVLDDPSPVIKVNELADSSVNFVCRPWSKTSDYWDVYWDVTRKVKEEFDANGISIPFPQQDVHMHQVPGGNG